MKFDLENNVSCVNRNGLLVMDIASHYDADSVFWERRESVFLSCELTLPMMGLISVSSGGHHQIDWRVR